MRGFEIVAPSDVVSVLGKDALIFSRSAKTSDEGIQMTPRRTGTDGFFVSVLRK